jgi:hypothetical protein
MNGRRPARSRRWRLTGFRYRWRHESRLADQDRNRTRRLPRRARRNDRGRAAVFLTYPFEPASDGNPGGEFNALYLFDATGEFVSAQIESFGPRGTFNRESKEVAYRQLLEGLGAIAFQRIEVAPFEVERFGTKFGLIGRDCEDEDDVLAVEVQPGNYMAFFEPWDSSEYDT